MLPRLKRLIPALLLAAALPACGTITSGTSQSVSILTEPAGASCTLTREGAVVGIVNPSPGTITVSKSSRDIAVRCLRAGHSPGVNIIPAQFQAMTAGNILLGGVIGLAIDAASGAISRYPESTIIVLAPEAFTSARGRDDFFDGRIADTRRSFDERITAARGTCTPETRDMCNSQVEGLTRERDEELARLDRLRRDARIGA
jgi:hypothetical protein